MSYYHCGNYLLYSNGEILTCPYYSCFIRAHSEALIQSILRASLMTLSTNWADLHLLLFSESFIEQKVLFSVTLLLVPHIYKELSIITHVGVSG